MIFAVSFCFCSRSPLGCFRRLRSIYCRASADLIHILILLPHRLVHQRRRNALLHQSLLHPALRQASRSPAAAAQSPPQTWRHSGSPSSFSFAITLSTSARPLSSGSPKHARSAAAAGRARSSSSRPATSPRSPATPYTPAASAVSLPARMPRINAPSSRQRDCARALRSHTCSCRATGRTSRPPSHTRAASSAASAPSAPRPENTASCSARRAVAAP